MISYLDCYPCLVRHSLEASRQVTDDPTLQRKVLNRVLKLLPELPKDSTPIRMAALAHAIIREELGVEDPYAQGKKRCNELAMEYVPQLKWTLDASKDRIKTAVRIAIAGNIIDMAALGETFDVEATLRQTLDSELGVDHTSFFQEDLKTAKKIVYVGDNTGEIVFDRLLVQEIKRVSDGEITFVVRGRPIQNDATLEDAKFTGLTDLVKVVPSTGDAPGCELQYAPEILALFQEADLIIAKGQGNYEALSLENFPIYFLLRVKCQVIAQDINSPKGCGVIKRSDSFQWRS